MTEDEFREQVERNIHRREGDEHMRCPFCDAHGHLYFDRQPMLLEISCEHKPRLEGIIDEVYSGPYNERRRAEEE